MRKKINMNRTQWNYVSLLGIVFLLLLNGCSGESRNGIHDETSEQKGTEQVRIEQTEGQSMHMEESSEEDSSVILDNHYSQNEDWIYQPWFADCDEFINLRTEPDTGAESLIQIPKDKEVILLAWQERFAFVEYEGQRGYVLSDYIKPLAKVDEITNLSVVQPSADYSYDQMCKDLECLSNLYPNSIQLGSIGTSGEGRRIPVVMLGSPEAEHHILLQGAIHGREHMSAWLLTALADYWAGRENEAFEKVCFHIIPMSNPDGVNLSQTGEFTPIEEDIYAADLTSGYTEADPDEYASRWKANGFGVDLNRNFDAGWNGENGRPTPSAELYWGDEPCSAPESAALRDYTSSRSFDATISYHASGSVIYYEYGEDMNLRSRCRTLAETIGKVTGYNLADSDSVESGGYKDWAIEALGIPSLTVEIGCQEAPLAERELSPVFARNLDVLPALAHWAFE